MDELGLAVAKGLPGFEQEYMTLAGDQVDQPLFQLGGEGAIAERDLLRLGVVEIGNEVVAAARSQGVAQQKGVARGDRACGHAAFSGSAGLPRRLSQISRAAPMLMAESATLNAGQAKLR